MQAARPTVAEMAATIPCPACGRTVRLEGPERSVEAPFCGPRCRNLDIGGWADGRYAVPGARIEHEPGAGPDPEGPPR